MNIDLKEIKLDMKVAFRYSLRVLKIYSIRNAHYRYWILAVNNGTQPKSLKFIFKRAFRTRFIILYYFISLLRDHTGFARAHTLKEIIAPSKCLKTIIEYRILTTQEIFFLCYKLFLIKPLKWYLVSNFRIYWKHQIILYNLLMIQNIFLNIEITAFLMYFYEVF